MTKYLETVDTDWYKQRLIGVTLSLLAAFAIIVARLFYLQILEGANYRLLSDNNCIRRQPIAPTRGLIYDRHGHRLVDNRPSFDLSIIIKDASPLEVTVKKLAKHLGISSEVLMARLSKYKGLYTYNPVLLKQDIGRDALARIEAHSFDLPGVIVNVKPRRNYINKTSAAHLMGYLSEIGQRELSKAEYEDYKPGDYIGKVGVEKEYESYLRGRKGDRLVEVNVTGQVVKILKTIDASSGNNVYLTLDRNMQLRAEELLAGVAGAAVALDVSNGHVLAMVSSPSFDQNYFVSGMTSSQWDSMINNPFRPLNNKAIQGEYPPGSTYKIITAVAGLDEGVIDGNTTYFCPGHLTFGDRTFRCWKKGGHGTVNVVDAIAQSCDVFFYITGQKIGVDKLAWYAKALGLGRQTGISLAHESEGLIPTAAWKKKRFGVPWRGGETLSIAIGQGYNLTTPLQLAVMTSAVANNGTWYKPVIIKKIEPTNGGSVIENDSKIGGRYSFKKDTLDLVKKGLFKVVHGARGTARIAKIKGVHISGKTGTAQVIGHKQGDTKREYKTDHHKPHALFVAYAPSDNPRIAVSVIVEHGEHGSSAAAPIARELIREYLASEKSGLVAELKP